MKTLRRFLSHINVFSCPSALKTILDPKMPVAIIDLNGVVFDLRPNKQGVLEINPQAIDALKIIKSKGYQIVLWTAANKQIIKDVQQHPELEALITVILTRENYHLEDKPRVKILKGLYNNAVWKALVKPSSFNCIVEFFETANDNKFFMLLGLHQDVLFIDDDNRIQAFVKNYLVSNSPDFETTTAKTSIGSTWTILKPEQWCSQQRTQTDRTFGSRFLAMHGFV
jgi:hypothetical protein